VRAISCNKADFRCSEYLTEGLVEINPLDLPSSVLMCSLLWYIQNIASLYAKLGFSTQVPPGEGKEGLTEPVVASLRTRVTLLGAAPESDIDSKVAKVPHLDLDLSKLKKNGKRVPLNAEVSSFLSALTFALPALITPVTAQVKKKKGKSMSNSKSGSANSVSKASDATNWSILSTPTPATKMRLVANGGVYRVTQEVNIGLILATSTTAPTFAAYNFTVSTIDQISTFAGIFDQYKVDEMEAWIVPFAGANNTLTQYASVIDYDDSAVLTTFAQALDYTNVVVTSLSDGQYRRWIPHIAVAAYSGAFTSFTNVVAPWIDMTSTGVQHYGLKIAALATSVANIPIDLIVRFRVSFRNVR